MHTFLYARVSTTDQTISHQRAQAEAAGFKFDEVIEDAGVSGVTTKFKDRKGGAKLLDKLRRGDVLVVRWVDRLGRNYDDVTETIRTLMQRGVVVRTIINGMTFYGATKDPIQRAAGDAATKYRCRKPTFDVEQLHRTHELLTMGWTPSAISAEVGIPRATVYRITEDPAKAVALLQTWGIS